MTMNSQRAKEVLISYRPGLENPADPETAAALDLVKKDLELAHWFNNQQAFHSAARQAFHNLPAPAELKDKILHQSPRSSPPILWLNRFESLAAAAVVVLLLSLAVFWMQPDEEERKLADYRARMAKFALREYRMDLVTNDLSQIRAFLANRGAPAGYVLSPRLQKLPGLGCAALKWQDQPVSLICFRLGEEDLVWLFVTPQSTVQDPPPSSDPHYQAVGKLMTASWTYQGMTYLLAVVGDQSLLQRYL